MTLSQTCSTTENRLMIPKPKNAYGREITDITDNKLKSNNYKTVKNRKNNKKKAPACQTVSH